MKPSRWLRFARRAWLDYALVLIARRPACGCVATGGKGAQ
jgi:hypothetical protein